MPRKRRVKAMHLKLDGLTTLIAALKYYMENVDTGHQFGLHNFTFCDLSFKAILEEAESELKEIKNVFLEGVSCDRRGTL